MVEPLAEGPAAVAAASNCLLDTDLQFMTLGFIQVGIPVIGGWLSVDSIVETRSVGFEGLGVRTQHWSRMDGAR